jgi:glycosyltransferase involved in cell wall biosynthesis
MKMIYISFPDLNGSTGACTHVREILRNLSTNNSVTVVSPTKNPPKFGDNITFKRCRYIDIEFLRAFTFSINAFFICFFYLLKNKCDLIYERDHAFGTGCNLTLFFNIPVIMEVNGISNETGRFPEPVAKIINLVLHNRYSIATHIITVTPKLKEFLQLRYNLPSDKVSVVENGANIDLFKPMNKESTLKKLDLDPEFKYVCFVGHLAPWQGVEYLIKSSSFILSKCPNTKFIIVGDGPRLDELKKLVDTLNVSNNYLFTGYVDYETVPVYINASDICVAPFVIERNDRIGLSALKIYEYLACGKPVVASRIKGIEELLSASNGGISVTPEDVCDLGKAIVRLLQDDLLCENMGTEGYKFIRDHHSWKIAASNVEHISCKIINSSNKNYSS